MQGHEKKLDEMKQLDIPVNGEKEERESRKKIMSGIMNDEKFTTPTWTYRITLDSFKTDFSEVLQHFWCEKLKISLKYTFKSGIF